MARGLSYRQYAVLEATDVLRDLYWSEPPEKREKLRDYTATMLGSDKELDFLNDKEKFDVLAAPLSEWTPYISGYGDIERDDGKPDVVVISYGFARSDYAHAFREFIDRRRPHPFLEIGADPGAEPADQWCPEGATQPAFGDRAAAECMLNAEVLPENGLDGKNVNVVIIDEGMCKEAIPSANWGGGFRHKSIMPGTAPPASHGMLVARNILKLAPKAILYDLPLLPRRPKHITEVLAFASSAHSAYLRLLFLIAILRHHPRWSGPWVFVNAWAILDRASEIPLGDYTENTRPGGHPLNRLIGQTTMFHRVDTIFAAGNCGLFCPNRRCGKLDRGPGRSIWGANSHPGVITVGAIRSDLLWLGYSSEGPGQVRLSTQKPDLCAPSHFHETDDAHRRNTGTSTSCALTAGIVAALRSKPGWDADAIPPASLKQTLNDTALKYKGPGWNGRIGHGVLNARAAHDKLSLDYSESLFAPIARSCPPRAPA